MSCVLFSFAGWPFNRNESASFAHFLRSVSSTLSGVRRGNNQLCPYLCILCICIFVQSNPSDPTWAALISPATSDPCWATTHWDNSPSSSTSAQNFSKFSAPPRITEKEKFFLKIIFSSLLAGASVLLWVIRECSAYLVPSMGDRDGSGVKEPQSRTTLKTLAEKVETENLEEEDLGKRVSREGFNHLEMVWYEENRAKAEHGVIFNIPIHEWNFRYSNPFYRGARRMHVPPNLMKISKTLWLLTSNHFKHLQRVGGGGGLGWSGGVVEPLFEIFCFPLYSCCPSLRISQA